LITAVGTGIPAALDRSAGRVPEQANRSVLWGLTSHPAPAGRLTDERYWVRSALCGRPEGVPVPALRDSAPARPGGYDGAKGRSVARANVGILRWLSPSLHSRARRSARSDSRPGATLAVRRWA